MVKHADLIVMNHHPLPHVGDCLASIRDHTTYPHRIFVVNNTADPQTKAFLQSQRDTMLVDNSAEPGYASGANRGIAAGDGEYIVILRADVRVTDRWLEPLINCLQTNAGVAIVGPKILNEKNEVVSAGAVGRESRYRMRGGMIPDGPGVYSEYTRCVTVAGTCYAIKRSLLPRIGLFDTAFSFYFEEVDYSFRARDLGFQVVYCPESRVVWLDDNSLSDERSRHTHLTESRALLEVKWHHKMSRLRTGSIKRGRQLTDGAHHAVPRGRRRRRVRT